MSGRELYESFRAGSEPATGFLAALRGLAADRRASLAWAEVDELDDTEGADDQPARLAASTLASQWPATFADAIRTVVLGRDPTQGSYIALDLGKGLTWITAIGQRVRLLPGQEAVVPMLPWVPDMIVVEDADGAHLLKRTE